VSIRSPGRGLTRRDVRPCRRRCDNSVMIIPFTVLRLTDGPPAAGKRLGGGSPSSGPLGSCRGCVIGPELSRSARLEQRLRWYVAQWDSGPAMSGHVVIIPSIAPNPTISRLSRCSCTPGYRLRLVRKTQEVTAIALRTSCTDVRTVDMQLPYLRLR
jgi:hypothetical protein